MKRFTRLATVVFAGAVAASLATQAAEKPKYTVEEIMKAINKGKGNESVCGRVLSGEASADDVKKLIEYYASLPLNEPSQGDAKVWKQKTTALVAAAKGLQKGGPDALQTFKDAVNCKACHQEFKPKKQ